MQRWQDAATRKAFREGYPARSVYKLKEINNKYNVMHKNDVVLDLGAHPGSWAQYAKEKVGSKGMILAYDVKPTELKDTTAIFLQEDVLKLKKSDILARVPRVNVLLSDMMPSTTGHLDQEVSYELASHALRLAVSLKARAVVIKYFEGAESPKLVKDAKAFFAFVKSMRPTTTRKGSKEFFLVGLQQKP